MQPRKLSSESLKRDIASDVRDAVADGIMRDLHGQFTDDVSNYLADRDRAGAWSSGRFSRIQEGVDDAS